MKIPGKTFTPILPTIAEEEPENQHNVAPPQAQAKRLEQSLEKKVLARKKQQTTSKQENAPYGFRHRISQHAVDVSIAIPGSGRTINRPLRTSIPDINIEDHDDDDEDSLLHQSRLLMRHTHAFIASLEASKSSLWQRPAESAMRKRLTRLIPWLKPAPLQTVATLYGSASANPLKNDESADRQEIAQHVQQLQQQMTTQLQELETAAGEVHDLSEQHPAENPAQRALRQERIRLAEGRLTAIQAKLKEHVEHPATVEVFKLSEYADLADQKIAFAQKRLHELTESASHILTHSDEQTQSAHLKLEANKVKIQTLMTVGVSMDKASAEVHTSTEKLAEIQHALATLTQSPDTEERHEQLEKDILYYQILQESAENTLAENLAQLNELDVDTANTEENIDAQLKSLNSDNKALLQKIEGASQQRANASQSIALLKTITPPNPVSDDAAPEKATLEQLKHDLHQSIATQAGPRLTPKLDALTDRLINDPSLTKQPPWLVIDIVMTTLRAAVGENDNLASDVVDALARHPAEHWLDNNDAGEQANAITAFCRTLSTLPRGMDLLQLLSSKGDATPDAETSRALRTFWTADSALEQRPEESVAAWLTQARRVARAKATQSEEPLNDVDLAAYNAVRNGYLSNAPGSLYDSDNQRLLKATNEWVVRAMAKRPQGTPRSWRQWVPNLNKTPFQSSMLKQAFDISQSMGMDSLRTQVDTQVNARLDELKQLCALGAEHGSDGDELTKFATSSQALIAHLQKKQKKGRHLSQIPLGKSDLRSIQREWQTAQPTGNTHGPAALGRHLRNRLAHAELSPLVTEICTTDLSLYEALGQLNTALRNLLPEAHRPAAPADTADFNDAIRLLKDNHFSDKNDILTFFQPLIEGSHLRDRVRMGGGGTLGLGLSSLPYNVMSVVAPTFSLEMARSDEAFAQLFMPILGMEMSFGKLKTLSAASSIGMMAGGDVVPGVVALQASISGKLQHQHAETEATLMRFFRKRFQDDEMRQKMINCLESMVLWDTLEPQQGQPYSSPLEAVLARNPDVSLSHVSARSQTLNVSGQITGRLFARHQSNAHASQWISPEVALSADSERTHDHRVEKNGAVHIDGLHNDAAQQRIRWHAALNMSPVSNTPDQTDKTKGATGRFSFPFQLGISRDLSWNLERHEISPFTIDDKQDADIDRHYSSAVDMQAEIASNRDEWLMRCIETLEPEADQRDTPELRQQAAAIMDEFEQTLAQLSTRSKYCHYNVNYSLKGEAGAEIDSYRALAQLARQNKDEAHARQMENAIDDILKMRGSWRPLMLIIRERARDSRSTGINAAIRYQFTKSNDGQRTAAQFPPP